MTIYKNREYTDMILALGVCGDNASAATNYYQAQYPNCQANMEIAFNKEPGMWKKYSRTQNKLTISVKNLFLRHNVSVTTIIRVLHEQEIYPYHFTRNHNLRSYTISLGTPCIIEGIQDNETNKSILYKIYPKNIRPCAMAGKRAKCDQ
uniref:Uncharacterized protein n=1 Tax=Vespula pensylvanica TaxID=30213 RepID=A0A834N6X0_VESPE|nr:hypothetical protein H0235_016711 [Vespula pensylvanica]